MNELMELSNDIKQIELEIKHHKNIAGQSIWEIGRRLNHVKENDLAHGEFGRWLEKIGIEHRTANRFMKISKEIPYSTPVSKLGYSVIDLIATLPEEQKEMELEKANQGEPSTRRELEEIKRKNREQEKIIEELKNKEPEIIEKEVIKEVEPEDYQFVKNRSDKLENTIRELKRSVQDKDLQLEQVVHQKEMLEMKAEMNEKDSNKYKQLKTQIENLSQEKNELGRQIRTRTELSGLVVTVEHFLKTELAPIKYSRAIREASDDELVQDNLKEIVDRVQDWCNEMYEYVKDNDIIDTEVIYNE